MQSRYASNPSVKSKKGKICKVSSISRIAEKYIYIFGFTDAPDSAKTKKSTQYVAQM